MNKIISVYRLLNILSIDVAAGAVVCAVFFARIFDVHIKSYGLISLGLTVWIIYTADHLLDAIKIHQQASTKRHRFHQKYFKTLCGIVVLAIIIDAVQIFFIRKPIVISGLLLGVLVVLYFFIQRNVNYVKELFGALLYSSGVLLTPLSLSDKTVSLFQMMLIIQFFLTALINLILFSMFDNERDLQDKHQSFTTSFGLRTAYIVLSVLFILNAILGIMQLQNHEYIVFVSIVAAMNLVLLLIMLNKKYFEIGDRYRLLGDAVFLFPLIYLLF